jgi:hypothetical protein
MKHTKSHLENESTHIQVKHRQKIGIFIGKIKT